MIGLISHLIQDGLLQSESIHSILLEAKQQDLSLVSYLVKNNIVDSEKIKQCCTKNFGLPAFDLDDYDMSWLDKLPINLDFIYRYRVIPLEKHNGILHIGIADPTDQSAIDAMTFHSGLKTFPVIVSEKQLTQFIEKYCQKNSPEKNLELSLLQEITLEEKSYLLQENVINYDEPLIKFVNHVIQHAIQQTASDIHIEPFEHFCRIRYRRDGILCTIKEIPNNLALRFITRLKVMAKLDIAERRLPQDGRFQLHALDIRINTCPTLFGEKIVLRLLNSNKIALDINTLGFSNAQKELFIKKISQPHGMILVVGPTGSGKTVTLYSALHYLNMPEKNISTVEDPIEIQLTGINQVNVNPKIHLDFATILRTLLRQDPDIIMVGEIRDQETANVAMQSAQTGHLVLSTLHTNSAVETITRLQSMGIATYNIVSSISLIIAQRLIRKLCSFCKIPDGSSPAQLLRMGFPETVVAQQKIYRAKGCEKCLQGYQGRTGIYEILPLTENINELLLANANSTEINAHIKKHGHPSLHLAGIEKVLQGITSLTEINRVILM